MDGKGIYNAQKKNLIIDDQSPSVQAIQIKQNADVFNIKEMFTDKDLNAVQSRKRSPITKFP